jgi:methionyl-tRNA formyltransferase
MSKTITFFGSGPVAASSLEKLAANFDIEAVVTKPKPEHHKYLFPVIETANKLGLKLHTPSDKHELKELFDQSPVNGTLGVVIDYGIMIPESVINFFPLGIVNSHFSLLPHLRGADPITFSILEGDSKTGVSLMLIVPALDEGPLLAQEELELDASITTPILTDELIDLSDEMLKKYLPKYIEGQVSPVPQSEDNISYSRKLNKADSILDWQKPAKKLEREVRAFIEWPRSRTELSGNRVIVTRSHVKEGSGSPGKISVDGKELGVFTSKGVLIIDRLIPEGKKEMSAEAFLAGYSLKLN